MGIIWNGFRFISGLRCTRCVFYVLLHSFNYFFLKTLRTEKMVTLKPMVLPGAQAPPHRSPIDIYHEAVLDSLQQARWVYGSCNTQLTSKIHSYIYQWTSPSANRSPNSSVERRLFYKSFPWILWTLPADLLAIINLFPSPGYHTEGSIFKPGKKTWRRKKTDVDFLFWFSVSGDRKKGEEKQTNYD